MPYLPIGKQLSVLITHLFWILMRENFQQQRLLRIFCGVAFLLFLYSATASQADVTLQNGDDPVFSEHAILIQLHPKYDVAVDVKKPLNTGIQSLDSLNLMFNATEILPMVNSHSSGDRVIRNNLKHCYLIRFARRINLSLALQSYQSLECIDIAEPDYFYYAPTSSAIEDADQDLIQLAQSQLLINPRQPVIISVVGVPVGKKNSSSASQFFPINDPLLFGNVNADTSRSNMESAIDSDSAPGMVKFISRFFDQFPTDQDQILAYQIIAFGAENSPVNGNHSLTTFSAASAIISAVNSGAKILTFFVGGYHHSSILEMAIEYAASQN
ncbi:MAG: hypothetical protein SCK70_03635, partial [bacterium]|nr:hypothetical protein [bacterium]